jgi:hypothetical protein
MRVRPRGLAALCAGTACVGLLAMGGNALAGTNIYVSHAPKTESGKHGCTKPNWNTIKDAIDATGSTPNTIVVCNGTYAEKVVIKHPLTLLGKTGATIVPPADPAQWTGALVLVNTDGGVLSTTTVKGLTIDGQDRAGVPDTNGARSADAPVGIRVEDSNALIQGNVVRGVEDPAAFGSQFGLGILVHASTGVAINDARVIGNTVEDFQKGGITVDAGDLANPLTAPNGTIAGSVSGNIVTGVGPTPLTAQNGIQISRGAATSVAGDIISGTAYTGSASCATSCDTAAGILLYQAGSGVKVSGNQLSVFDEGISLVDSPGADIAGNILDDAGREHETDGCRPVIFGIYADFSNQSTGAQTITIENNTLDHLKLSGDLLGCQTGSGIRVDAESGSPAVTSVIKNNNVANFQKNGIVLRGDGNHGTVTHNTVTGLGTQSAIAQNLIEVAFDATATIGGKTTKQGNQLWSFGAYTGPGDDASAAILLYNVAAGVKINNNTFHEGAGLVTAQNGALTQGGYTVLLANSATHTTHPDVDATKNTWGHTFTVSDIAERIYDHYDDPSSGFVTFSPFTYLP